MPVKVCQLQNIHYQLFMSTAIHYLSWSGMLEMLQRLNLSYTKPTYNLAKADPQKQEEFKQEFELLKKPSGR
jgi:transposase